MKKSFVVLMLLLCISIQAQERKVEFKLQPTGAFLSDDGKDFVVIEFEGKSSDELLSMVKANVMSLYNSPKEVMSESNGIITIYAYNKYIWLAKSLGAKAIYGGHYNLVFKFKDGKIRIDAPTISEKLEMSDGAFTNTIGIHENVYLSSCAKKACKKSNSEKKKHIEDVVNNPINDILGLSENQKRKVDEDW